MAKLSKRVKAFRARVDANKSYSLDEAIAILKETATVKFNESVEVILELSEKVNNLENLIYNQPKNKKSRKLLFFFNLKLISILISIFIVGYVFLLMPIDTSVINQILNDMCFHEINGNRYSKFYAQTKKNICNFENIIEKVMDGQDV